MTSYEKGWRDAEKRFGAKIERLQAELAQYRRLVILGVLAETYNDVVFEAAEAKAVYRGHQYDPMDSDGLSGGKSLTEGGG